MDVIWCAYDDRKYQNYRSHKSYVSTATHDVCVIRPRLVIKRTALDEPNVTTTITVYG